MTSLLKVLLLLSLVTLAQAQWEAARRKLKEMDQKVQQNFARDFDEEAVGSWWGWMDNFIQEADAEVSKLAQDTEKAFLQTLTDFLPKFTPEFPPNLQMIGKSILSYLADEVKEFVDFVKDALEEEFTELVHGIEEDCKDVIDGITAMFDGDLGKTLTDFEAVAQGMDSNCFSPLWNVAHNLGLNTGSSSNGEESAVGDKWDWEVAGSTDYIGEQFSLGIAYAVTLSQRKDRIETKDNIFPLPKGSVQGQGQLLLGGGDYVKVDDSGNIEETKRRFEAGFQTQVAACVDIMDSHFLSCDDALTDGTDGVGAMVPDLSFSFNKGPPDGQHGFGATLEIGIPIGEGGALHIGLAWNVNPDGTCPFSGISLAWVPAEHEVSILGWATHANYWPINWLTFDWDLDSIQTKDTGEGKMKSVLPHMAGKTPSKICMFESAKENKKPTDDDTPNQWAPCKNSDDCKQYNVEVTSDEGMAAWKTETNAIRYCNQWEQCGGFWKKQDGHFWAMDKKAASKLQPADDSTGTFLKSCSLNNHASVSDESGCECAGEDGDAQDSGSDGNQCTVEGNDGVAWCYVKDYTKCRAPHNGYSDAFGDHSDKWWSEEPCKRNLCKCRGADGADDGVTGSTCTFQWDDKSDIVRRKAQAWCYLPYSDNVYNCPGATISGNNDDNGYQQYWSYEPCKDYTGTAENSADRENSVAGMLPDKENSVGDGDEDESHVMWPASQSWNTDDAITLDPSSLVNFHYGSSASGDAPSAAFNEQSVGHEHGEFKCHGKTKDTHKEKCEKLVNEWCNRVWKGHEDVCHKIMTKNEEEHGMEEVYNHWSEKIWAEYEGKYPLFWSGFWIDGEDPQDKTFIKAADFIGKMKEFREEWYVDVMNTKYDTPHPTDDKGAKFFADFGSTCREGCNDNMNTFFNNWSIMFTKAAIKNMIEPHHGHKRGIMMLSNSVAVTGDESKRPFNKKTFWERELPIILKECAEEKEKGTWKFKDAYESLRDVTLYVNHELGGEYDKLFKEKFKDLFKLHIYDCKHNCKTAIEMVQHHFKQDPNHPENNIPVEAECDKHHGECWKESDLEDKKLEQAIGDGERMIQSVAAADTMNNRVILFFAFIGTCAIILQFVDCARKSACPTHDFSPIEDEI